MNLKSSMNVAQNMRCLFKASGDEIDKNHVQFATESTLAAVAQGQRMYQNIASNMDKYKSLLINDAENIGSLGAQFESLDAAIAKSVDDHF